MVAPGRWEDLGPSSAEMHRALGGVPASLGTPPLPQLALNPYPHAPSRQREYRTRYQASYRARRRAAALAAS